MSTTNQNPPASSTAASTSASVAAAPVTPSSKKVAIKRLAVTATAPRLPLEPLLKPIPKTKTKAIAAVKKPVAAPIAAPIASPAANRVAATAGISKPAAKPAAPSATKSAKAVKSTNGLKAVKSAQPSVKPAPAAQKAVTVAPAAAKAEKPKKAKLVRDSFTIPKTEYLVLDELKLRANKLLNPVKKSELLRAGIKALSAMTDSALLAALKQVPAIKTGRPAGKA